MLLLQGLDDPVVPPDQSEVIAADLAAHGIKHAYITFEGESHGFRGPTRDHLAGGGTVLLRADPGSRVPSSRYTVPVRKLSRSGGSASGRIRWRGIP